MTEVRRGVVDLRDHVERLSLLVLNLGLEEEELVLEGEGRG